MCVETQLRQKIKKICPGMSCEEEAEAIAQVIEELVSNSSMREKKSSRGGKL